MKAAKIFAAAAFSVFAVFVLLHPLDWQQPETLRLHYFACQTGIRDGPLSSRLQANDFLKPLSTAARGGAYEFRYVGYLIDGLLPKLYLRLFSLTGPFLGEPFNVLLIILTALILVLAVREWFCSLPAGLVYAGAWLVTSQTLLDSRYPIRPNMALSVALVAYILWEMLRLPRRRSPLGAGIRAGLAFFCALASQEWCFFSLFPLALIGLTRGREFRPAVLKFLLCLIFSAGLYALFFFFVTPFLMRRLFGEQPLTSWLQDASPFELLTPAVLVRRLKEFTLPGLRYFLQENAGLSLVVPRGERLGGVAGLILVLTAGIPFWKRGVIPFLAALFYYVPTSLVLFPYFPSAMEMPVYYYAMIVIWWMLPLGALCAGVFGRGQRMRTAVLLSGLLLIAGVNLHHSHLVMGMMPGDFGFNPSMRAYVRDALSLARGGPAGPPAPVYLSYPRPRRFDVSTKWDLMLRVWHGEAPRVFALMVPVLGLRQFVSGSFRGDPDEFSAWAGTPSERYEAPVVAFADLPNRRFCDLRPLRSQGMNLLVPPIWRTAGGMTMTSRREETLLGRTFRSILPPGEWECEIAWEHPGPSAGLLIFASRADLQAPGSDEVWYRTQPLQEKTCRFEIRRPSGSRFLEQTYGWSYQLQTVKIGEGGESPVMSLRVITEGPAELIGPLLLPSTALRYFPLRDGDMAGKAGG